MGNIPVFVIILFSSFMPAGVAMVWLNKQRPPFPVIFQLCCLSGGILSLALAISFQSLLPGAPERTRPAWFDMFIHVAFPEEAARFVSLVILFRLTQLFFPKMPLGKGKVAGAGLLLGVMFATLETAGHAVLGPGIALVRAFTASPLHGSCGIRCALAVFNLKRAPLTAARYFFSALCFHALYNIMLRSGPILTLGAAFLAISALLSSLVNIKPDDNALTNAMP